MAIKKYRMLCKTENVFVDVISTNVPTQCPNNAAHTVEGIAVIDDDVLVNDGTVTDLTLADYKQLRYNEIDGKTRALLAAGFTYDGKAFSLSVPAQFNWDTIKGNKPDFTFPLEISCLNCDTYLLQNNGDVESFWSAGRDAVKAHLDSGRALKKSIFDAVDKAGVDAVVDTR